MGATDRSFGLIRRAAMPALAVIVTSTAALCSAPAAAQSSGYDDSQFYDPLPEYTPLGVSLGNARIYPELDALVEYDSNIFALPEDEKDDRISYLIPRLRTELNHGAWQFRGLAQAQVRRFHKYESENSTSGIVEGNARWSPREGETFRGGAGWQRVVEDRGDPESNTLPDTGPRRLNAYRAELGYRRERGTWLLNLGSQVSKFDYIAAADVFRDHTTWTGQASLGRQVGGLTFATITTFVNRRNFTRVDFTGVSRDATTYGVRGGVEINPGGILYGEASVGVFKFDPADSAIDAYAGLSLAGNVSYRPTERTTINLEAFSGNVATYLAGAISRTDSRLQLNLQQEIRHNLYGRVSAFVRNTHYRGNRESERTVGTEGELEYLVNRHVGITLNARYANRNSDDPFEEFHRFRGLAGVRLHY